MSTQTKRLDKVEGSLTPREAALLWLREAHQHPDSAAYSRSLKGQPVSAFPMSVMERQVEGSVRARMKGEKREQVEAAIVQAQRDCIFLFEVAMTANREWYEHERALRIGRLALASMLRPLLDHRAEGAGPQGKQRDAYLERAEHFARFAESFLGETLVLRAAFAALGERYFDGEPLLFREAAEAIDELVQGLETIATFYNEAVADGLPVRKHPELRAMTAGELEAVMGEAVPELVEYLVVRAKAEALTVLGEVNAAADLMGRYV